MTRTAPATRPATRARSTTPPALPKLDVQVPQWPALDKARRRLDKVQDVTGRVTTLAGAALAATGMFTDAVTVPALLADAAFTVGGLVTLRLWKPRGHQRAAATGLYVIPGAALAVTLVGERLVPGIHWSEALALTLWTTGTWVMRPARLGRQMVAAPPPPAPVTVVAPVDEPADGHPMALWWARTVAVEGGTAPDTVLEDIERTGETSVRAVIRSAVAGRAVPDISIKNLSALMDVPEDDIKIGPVSGRGAGVRLLMIGTPDQDSDDPATVWAKRIAPKAMPGAVLTGVRVGRLGAPTTPKDDG